MRVRLVFAAALLVTLTTFSASAFADVIGFRMGCPPWQDARPVSHTGVVCTPRACVRDGQCSGGHCYTGRVCVVEERETGPCPDGTCAEGTCQTRGTCDQ
jgi:hypothetical protein